MSASTRPVSSSPPLPLPLPDRLPYRWTDLTAAVRAAGGGAPVMTALADPAARADLRTRLDRALSAAGPGIPDQRAEGAHVVAPPGPAARAEQLEHDRYFAVTRIGGEPGVAFVAGLAHAYIATYENCVNMGVTLLDDTGWNVLFEGLAALSGTPAPPAPPLPLPATWRSDYDPALRWLIGHQLFFALIQGAITGLNCYASAHSDGDANGAERGLALAAAFMRSSAAAMRFTTDFATSDYDLTVRPAMAPPSVREGFSGLQTRDHAHLVRLFGALKPVLAASGGSPGHEEFVEAVVSAYAAHEFICARFRGDVLPSLRMAAGSHGKTQRPGVEVVRELMRARLALIDPLASDVTTAGARA